MSKTALAWLIAYGAGLLLSVVDPFYALLAYLLDYYAHPPLRWWGLALPDLRWSLLAAGVLLLAYLFNGRSLVDRSILRHRQTKWLLGFLGVAILVTAFAVSVDRSLHYLSDIAKLTLLYLLILGTVRTRSQFRWFVLVMIVGAFIWGVDAFENPKRKAGRLVGIGGPDSDADNSTAAHLLTVLPFLAVYLLKGTAWMRAVCLVAAPFIVNTLILCNSRGASVAIAVAGLSSLLLARGKTRLQLGAMVLLAGVLFVALTDRTFLNRQVTLFSSEQDTSTTGRLDAWKGALELMRDRPFGSGGGGWDIMSPVYIPEVVEAHGGQERTVHNTYLLAGADWGVPGLVLFLGFIASTLRQLHRIRNETGDELIYVESLALEVGLIGFLTAAVFINRLYAEVLYWFAALSGALANINESRQEASEPVTAGNEAPAMSAAGLASQGPR